MLDIYLKLKKPQKNLLIFHKNPNEFQIFIIFYLTVTIANANAAVVILVVPKE